MKNFDISNLIVSKIRDVYDYSLEEYTEAKAVAKHSLLIIKRGGSSAYTVGAKTLRADAENIVFIPKDTEYSLYVEECGKCTIIEFDAVQDDKTLFCSFYFGGEKEILATIKNLLLFWKLKGPHITQNAFPSFTASLHRYLPFIRRPTRSRVNTA